MLFLELELLVGSKFSSEGGFGEKVRKIKSSLVKNKALNRLTNGLQKSVTNCKIFGILSFISDSTFDSVSGKTSKK